MIDQYGRTIDYLRLSITDRCNLRCTYCMPEEGITKKHHRDMLTFEELVEIVTAAVSLGIKKVRLTGGEPLVRREVVELVSRIAAIDQVEEVCMTTNGVLLPKYAMRLKEAGLHRLNISLDTLDPKRYATITRVGTVEQAIQGIDAQRAAGFIGSKLNAVLTTETTDQEIRDLVAFAQSKDMDLRFIEVMPIGEVAQRDKNTYDAGNRILKVVPGLNFRGVQGVAKIYGTSDSIRTVGLINPISAHFCRDCNRIRVTADGKLKPCLHSADEINLKGLTGSALSEALSTAIAGKPEKHCLNESISQSARNMNAIGG